MQSLIVEDDPHLNRLLARSLRRKPIHTVDQVTTLAGAFYHLAEKDSGYDVVILDRTLPDGDGLELIQPLKKDFPHTLLCVLSGISQEHEQRTALQAGADLYLCKPLSAQLVSEHVWAARRIHSLHEKKTQTWREFLLHPAQQTVQKRTDSEKTKLTKRECQFLSRFFSSDTGQVSHEQLRFTLPLSLRNNPTAAMHVTIQRLRKKLQSLGLTIVVHYGTGYELQAFSR